MAKFYHYTTMVHLEEIEKDGFLKLTESNVSKDKEHTGPDVVWLYEKPLKEVPKSMFSPLMQRSKDDPSKVSWTGVHIAKTQVELELDLDKKEIIRADKFLKKQKIDLDWLKHLDLVGGKTNKQYISTEKIGVEKISGIKTREDLINWRMDGNNKIYKA